MRRKHLASTKERSTTHRRGSSTKSRLASGSLPPPRQCRASVLPRPASRPCSPDCGCTSKNNGERLAVFNSYVSRPPKGVVSERRVRRDTTKSSRGARPDAQQLFSSPVSRIGPDSRPDEQPASACGVLPDLAGRRQWARSRTSGFSYTDGSA